MALYNLTLSKAFKPFSLPVSLGFITDISFALGRSNRKSKRFKVGQTWLESWFLAYCHFCWGKSCHLHRFYSPHLCCGWKRSHLHNSFHCWNKTSGKDLEKNWALPIWILSELKNQGKCNRTVRKHVQIFRFRIAVRDSEVLLGSQHEPWSWGGGLFPGI